MIGDEPNLLELRRRVQADPASPAFAQLAEQCRRAGDNEAAVDIARAGLEHHPNHASARVTLGRALIELGRFDEALSELTRVITVAPNHLAAHRALAETYQQRGQMTEAMVHYRRAMELATREPEIEPAVEAVEPVAEPFDFDRLIEQLGGGRELAGNVLPAGSALRNAVPSPVETVKLRHDDGDPFSVLERHLRDTEEQRGVVQELEEWLLAIVHDRSQSLRG